MIEIFNQIASVVASWGYPGLFAISFLESFIVPIVTDPFIIGATSYGMSIHAAVLVSIAGSLIGGSLGFYTGDHFGHPVAIRFFGAKTVDRGEKMFEKWGNWFVLVGAISPIPYKVVAWLAGIFEMKYSTFLIFSIIGRVPRFVIMAYLGEWLAAKILG